MAWRLSGLCRVGRSARERRVNLDSYSFQAGRSHIAIGAGLLSLDRIPAQENHRLNCKTGSTLRFCQIDCRSDEAKPVMAFSIGMIDPKENGTIPLHRSVRQVKFERYRSTSARTNITRCSRTIAQYGRFAGSFISESLGGPVR
jgi:hypothetical protein